jgi:hypothetical protein
MTSDWPPKGGFVIYVLGNCSRKALAGIMIAMYDPGQGLS